MSDSCATLLTVAHQAPLSLRFSRQEYWSAFPLPRPVNLPDAGIEPTSLHWQADSSPLGGLGESLLSFDSSI